MLQRGQPPPGQADHDFGDFLRVGSIARLPLIRALPRCLLLSQAEPRAARAFTVFPTSPELTVTSPVFRVLMLRRLRLPLPVAPRTGPF